MFLLNFNTFSYRTPPVAAFEVSLVKRNYKICSFSLKGKIIFFLTEDSHRSNTRVKQVLVCHCGTQVVIHYFYRD